MDFEFSEDQNLLRDQDQGFLEEELIQTTRKVGVGAMLPQGKIQQLKGFLKTATLLVSGRLFIIKRHTKEVWRSLKNKFQS